MNARDAQTGNTPLIAAVLGGHNVCIEFFLTQDCDLNMTNADGLTVLHILAKTGNEDGQFFSARVLFFFCSVLLNFLSS